MKKRSPYRRNTLSHWVKSAIIGHWRNGATPEQITEAINLPVPQIKKSFKNTNTHKP